MMKKVKFVNVFWVLFYILIFSLLLRGGFSYLDPDLGWHLKVGEEISRTKQVPQQNIYNYTYTGDWVDHEWLSDLIVYNIYTNWGYEILVIIFALLILLVLIGLNVFVSKKLKKNSSFYVIASLQLFGVLASMPHFGVRMQELALFFLLILLVIFEIYNDKKNWRWLLAMPPIFYLWANLHASFLLGLAIIFSWLGIKILEKIVSNNCRWFNFLNQEKMLSWSNIITFFSFSLGSFFVTLLTPYGLKLYEFLGGYKNRAYLSLIQEWLPQHHFPFHYDQLIYLALGALVLIFYVYFVYKGQKKLELWPFFISLLFLILSFKSRRHFPLFMVASFSLMVSFYSEFFQSAKALAYEKFLKITTLFCLVLVVLVQIVSIRPISNPFEEFCGNYPCGAKEFLERNPKFLEGNLLNHYGWGGYLIWNLEGKKIFIDGRLPQVEFAGQSFIEEFKSFFESREKAEEKLNQYNVKTVLIDAGNQFIYVKKWEKYIFYINIDESLSKNELRSFLKESSDWNLVYEDNTSQLYHREDGVYQSQE